MPLTANKLFLVNVSSDFLTASLTVNGEVPTEKIISVEEIVKEIKDLKIVIDDQGKKNIELFAADLAEQKIPKAIIIARGTPPKHDENGRIKKLFEEPQSDTGDPENTDASDNPDNPDNTDNTDNPKDSDNNEGPDDHENSGGSPACSQSHYEQSNIITVKNKQKLLQLIPPIPGADGTDIYGKPIPHRLSREASIKLGSNVCQEDDFIIATADGKVECNIEKVWVDDKLEINGNVDFSVGNIDFDGDVIIQKNILDMFNVHSHSTISVRGVIEAAHVHADLDLYGTGGMTGKEKGDFSAGRDIHAKYITNAKVRAGQNIVVNTEIIHCDLVCVGSLTVENGSLVGGQSVVTGGLKVKDLGSDIGVRTIVEVGIDDALRQKCQEVAPEIALHRRKAEKVRQVVEPLLQNQKYLNAEQKEKATELLYNASELEDKAKKLIEQLREVYQAAQQRAVAEIEVLNHIYSGIIIRFPKVEAIITSPLKGPLKIMPRKVEGVLRIVAIDNNSGALKILDAGATFDKLWDTIDELIGVQPDADSKPDPNSKTNSKTKSN